MPKPDGDTVVKWRKLAEDGYLYAEIARQYPDLRVGPGYEYDQGLNKWAVVGVSIELPVLNPPMQTPSLPPASTNARMFIGAWPMEPTLLAASWMLRKATMSS